MSEQRVTNKTEAREIKRVGGRVQHNSGRGPIAKGDGKLWPFLFDVKEYAKSFSVSLKVWAKAVSDAKAVDSSWVPALLLVLGTGRNRVRLWVIHDNMFQEMYEAWLEKYGEDDE